MIQRRQDLTRSNNRRSPPDHCICSDRSRYQLPCHVSRIRHLRAYYGCEWISLPFCWTSSDIFAIHTASCETKPHEQRRSLLISECIERTRQYLRCSHARKRHVWYGNAAWLLWYVAPQICVFMVMLNIFHLGIGAMTAPLVSTQFATMRHWSHFYFTSMSIATITCISSLLVFKLKSIESMPHSRSRNNIYAVQA